MIGTNASGARSFKYGSVRNFILELEVVLADGNVLNLKRGEVFADENGLLNFGNGVEFSIPTDIYTPLVKNAAGYYLRPEMDMIDLFIGAEGTLGFISKAKLKVHTIPKDYISLIIFFSSMDETFQFLQEVRDRLKSNFNSETENVIAARAIEFFDKNSLLLLKKDYSDIPEHAVSALRLEQECNDISKFDSLLNEWERFFSDCNISLESIWFGVDEFDKNKIRKMRHTLPVLVNEFISRRGTRKLGTDVSVPADVFPAFYNKVVA
jgi:D-lactate dehydrogenase (cytochrome)